MDIIKNILRQDNTFFIGRIAGVELLTAYDILNNNILDLPEDIRQLENNAGIYTKDNNSLRRYTEQLVESYKSCTVIAKWEGKVFEETGQGQKLIESLTPNIPKIDARLLEPYYFKDSWMDIIENKRVLIIHPFVETLKGQSAKIDKIFPDTDWFKGCTFSFIKPPITLAGNHKNIDWQVYLDNCKKEIKEIGNFDVALVAAGGYGMLISSYIYEELNKSVMYIGGALQLFFGVIGRRWFTNKDILALMNDDWIRPQKQDKPNNFDKVEKGCYW